LAREINQNFQFQSEKHPLIYGNKAKSLKEYSIYLSQLFAYEFSIDYVQNKKVLDHGCNIGYGSSILSKEAKFVIGVDLSDKAIREAKRIYKDCSKLKFIKYDGYVLPFSDNSFDVVLSFQVIEHITDYELYLTEIIRVLNIDGIAIFTTPNAKIRLDKNMVPWNKYHIREFTENQLGGLLSNYFSVVELKGLFAKEPLYSIEKTRVDDMRKISRKNIKIYNKKDTHGMSIIFKRLTQFVGGIIKLGEKFVKKKKNIDYNFENFTTKDYFYKDNDLDESLGISAICKNA